MLSTVEYKISLMKPKTDLSENRDFDYEILRWQTEWSLSTDENPVTLQHSNPDLYPNVVTIITILLTMPVSTATPERSFSTMHTVKTYLRSTMKTERLAALALMHAYRDIPVDVEAVIRQFCAKKIRRLAFDRISLSSTKIPDMFSTNVSLVRSLLLCTTTTTGCILLNIPYFLGQYGILAFAN